VQHLLGINEDEMQYFLLPTKSFIDHLKTDTFRQNTEAHNTTYEEKT